jgi:hypothetical protein
MKIKANEISVRPTIASFMNKPMSTGIGEWNDRIYPSTIYLMIEKNKIIKNMYLGE